MHKFLKLQLNLQFFAADGGAEGGSAGGDATGDGDKGGSTEGTDTTDTSGVDTSWIDSLYSEADENTDAIDETETMIPKKRFDSVNAKYKEVSGNAKTLTTEHETLKTAHTELTAAHKETAERVKSLEGVLSGMVDSHLESIDESYHDLIPTDKTVEEKLAWIIKAKEKGMFGGGSGSFEIEIGGMTNPGNKGGRNGRNTSGMNPLQLMQMGYGSN